MRCADVSTIRRAPHEGQALWVALKIGQPEADGGYKILNESESGWGTEKVIIEPLVAGKLHIVRCGWNRDPSGSELRVALDDRSLYSSKLAGYRINSSSRSGDDRAKTFNEPNIVSFDVNFSWCSY